jgi:hypothetical protein
LVTFFFWASSVVQRCHRLEVFFVICEGLFSSRIFIIMW